VKRACIFLATGVGDEFAEAINAALAAINGEYFGDAVNGIETSRSSFGQKAVPSGVVPLDTRGGFAARQFELAFHYIDSIRAEENHRATVSASELQYANDTQRIVGDVKNGVGITGNHRGLRADVNQELYSGRKILEVFGIAHVAVDERDAVARQALKVRFAATTYEVVHDHDAVILFCKANGKLGTHKPRAAGDENLQVSLLTRIHVSVSIVILQDLKIVASRNAPC